MVQVLAFIEAVDYDPALDNGLGAAVFLFGFGLFLYIWDKFRKYKRVLLKTARRVLLCKKRHMYETIRFYRYCKIHKREITYQMKERTRMEKAKRTTAISKAN